MKRLNLLLVFLFLSFSLYAQNFWQATNGPSAGAIRSLAINSSGDIFAGTYGSGVYRSTDNGNNWYPINTGMAFTKVYALAINSSGDIFAGTYGDGVFRSTDNGNNWTQVNNGLTNIFIYSLALNSNGDIYVGTNNNIFRSTNNGNNWTKVGNILGLESPIYSIAIYNGAIFTAASDNIIRSIDNGNNWTVMGSHIGGGFVGNTHVTSLAINSNGNIFAGNNYYHAVYRSIDNGNNWIQLAQANNNSFDSTHVNSLAINRSGYIFAGTESDGIFSSIDNGNTWTQINNGLTDTYVPSLAIKNYSGFVFAGTNTNGVFRSIKLSTPIPNSPANNSTGLSLTPTLVWSAISGADQYRLEVNTKSNFSGTVIYDNDAVGSVSKQIGALFDKTQYYWRVTALNNVGNSSDISSVYSFTTIKASLTFPANGATNVSTSPTLTWAAVTSADTYRLEVNTQNDFTGTVVYDNAVLTTNSQALSSLANSTIYFWRVTASSNAIAKINTSTIYNFTTITATSPQLSVTPTDIDLGSDQSGTGFTKNFTVKNIGSGTLTGNISESATWITSVSPSSFSLTTNQSQTITIQGSSPSTSPFSTDVSVTSNGGDQNVTVHGVVTSLPQLSVTPTDIDLGISQSGTNFSKTFTVKNTGGGTLTGNISESVNWITSLSPSSFSLTASQPTTVTIQGSFPIASPFTTDVSVTSNSGNQNVKVHGLVSPIGNRPPTWDTGGELTNQTISVGETLNFTYKASDLDGDALTYAFVGNHPADANLNATTGVFSWAPQTASQFPILITVSATDGKSPAIQTQAQITVQNSTITISGKVTYENTSSTPIVGAVVKLLIGTTLVSQVTTTANGDYSFGNLTGGNSYSLTASKTTGWPSSAVLASDALLAARNSIDPNVVLSTMQKLAADVTGNGNVTAGDALQILRRVVGQISSFQIADWQFEMKTVVVSTANVTANIKGIAAGDVNESATTLSK